MNWVRAKRKSSLECPNDKRAIINPLNCWTYPIVNLRYITFTVTLDSSHAFPLPHYSVPLDLAGITRNSLLH